jgi:hypothetical protein
MYVLLVLPLHFSFQYSEYDFSYCTDDVLTTQVHIHDVLCTVLS